MTLISRPRPWDVMMMLFNELYTMLLGFSGVMDLAPTSVQRIEILNDCQIGSNLGHPTGSCQYFFGSPRLVPLFVPDKQWVASWVEV